MSLPLISAPGLFPLVIPFPHNSSVCEAPCDCPTPKQKQQFVYGTRLEKSQSESNVENILKFQFP